YRHSRVGGNPVLSIVGIKSTLDARLRGHDRKAAHYFANRMLPRRIPRGAKWYGASVICLMLFAFLPHVAPAAQVQQVDVQRDGDRYRVEMDVRLNVDAHRAYEVFSDAAQLPHINPSIRIAQPLSEPGADRRLYTEVHLCIAVFCRTLHQVQ